MGRYKCHVRLARQQVAAVYTPSHIHNTPSLRTMVPGRHAKVVDECRCRLVSVILVVNVRQWDARKTADKRCHRYRKCP